MDDSGLVDGGERGRHADGEPERALGPERSLGVHPGRQGRPGHVLADQVRNITVDAGVDDPGGAEGGHAAGRLPLLREPVPREGVRPGVQGLERVPRPGGVVRLVDHTLAARTESGGEPVLPDTLRIVPRQR
nr:hypothetical protein [Streptomyces koyangensis]